MDFDVGLPTTRTLDDSDREFMDSLSDDLLTLREARMATLTHPLHHFYEPVVTASFCRLLLLSSVANIEWMIKTWQRGDSMKILSAYFSEKVTNGARIEALESAFREAGVGVSADVFSDYLAIKYLRNTVVHQEWKTYQRDWVAKRAFPTDVTRLTDKDWLRIWDTTQDMITYVGLTPFVSGSQQELGPRTLSVDSDWAAPLSREELRTILWNSLGRVRTRVDTAITSAVISPEFLWHRGLELDDIGSATRDEQVGLKRRYWEAARAAGEADFGAMVRCRSTCREALAFWLDYWRMTSERLSLQDLPMAGDRETLERLVRDRSFAKGPVPAVDRELAEASPDKLPMFLGGIEHPSIDPASIFSALCFGSRAYKAIPDLTPVYLLLGALPAIDPEHTPAYTEEGLNALEWFEAGQWWYTLVEARSPTDLSNLSMYREFARSYGASRSGHP
jgi:hypothetical protein